MAERIPDTLVGGWRRARAWHARDRFVSLWLLPFLLTPLLPRLYELVAHAAGASHDDATGLATLYWLQVWGRSFTRHDLTMVTLTAWAIVATCVHVLKGRMRRLVAHIAGIALLLAVPAAMPLAWWLRFKLAEPGYRASLTEGEARCWLDDWQTAPRHRKGGNRGSRSIHVIHFPARLGPVDYGPLRKARGCEEIQGFRELKRVDGDFYRVTSGYRQRR